MPNLETVIIGIGCFSEGTSAINPPKKARDAHFICSNNPKLTTIFINNLSFDDFSECTIESILMVIN